ncbi:hypothetical protein [Jiangella anatolica]|uniref:Uncharacterized protein n=1 Tax=Jiangella anatolica TaxID=2670374 RepID=A0A2W2BPB2_9ACTN|nr:hypothetical protein [Jiangella anatolica]PZF82184.1 hypothetical protein C1I92_17950 [Jiangella anatolica]
MRVSHTAVIERNGRFDTHFATEPYEAGWAGEARWFLRVASATGRWAVQTEISPDGHHWCAHGEAVRFDAPGLYTVGVTQFGGWLRLAAHPEQGEAHLHAQVYLTLKE